MLCSKFCLRIFPISKVVSLRKDVLNFRQLEEQSLRETVHLGTAWGVAENVFLHLVKLYTLAQPLLLSSLAGVDVL